MNNNQLPMTNDQTIPNDKITNHQTERGFDLEERTTKFAKKVIILCKMLTKNTINFQLIAQLIRSAGSVGANYREANDALSKKDFIHRMKIVRKESKETEHWLELVLEANQELSEQIHPLKNETVELKKIFSSIIARSI